MTTNRKLPSSTFAVWGTRCILATIAFSLLFLWARGEFQFIPSRSKAIAPWYVHFFFLGIAGLGLFGLLCTLTSKRGSFAAATLTVCSGVVWTSILLMMVRVVPPWFSLGLTLACMALPVSLAAILLRPDGSLSYQNCWITCFTVGLIALVFIPFKPPWSLQVFANTRVLDGQVNFWNEYHRNSAATLLGRFRFDFMLWSLSGGPPHYYDYVKEGRALICRERETLVRLGYFQKRDIPLGEIRLSEATPAIQDIRSKDGLWMMIPRQEENVVTVYASRPDMPLIEAAIARAKEQHKAKQ